MYVAIFKATVKELDSTHSAMAQKLRNKALSQFNCVKFEACNENGFEIALSYWHGLEDIKRWQRDAEHLVAQRLGKEKWYRDFSVEIWTVERAYFSQKRDCV